MSLADPIVGFLLVSVFFAVLLFLRGRAVDERDTRLEEERSAKLVHAENCGARFDGENWTIPLVRFAIYQRFLVLSCRRKLLLKIDEIERVSVDRYLFFRGLRIYHHKIGIPQQIVIWSRDCEKAKRTIEDLLQRQGLAKK